MTIGDVNILTIIITAAINIFLGGLWYSPKLFGKEWMELAQITEEKIKKMNLSFSYIGAYIVSLIMSFVLSHLLHLMQVNTLVGGVTVGFWIWLGFYATGQFSAVLWEQKPIKLYTIHTGFSLVSLVIISAILAVFG